MRILVTATTLVLMFIAWTTAGQTSSPYYTNTFRNIDSLVKIKQISEAIKLSDQLITWATENVGTKDTIYPNALAIKAECFIAAKKYPEALGLQKEALEIRRTIPGAQQSVVSSLNTIYQIHKMMGQQIIGASYMFEAVALQEQIDPNSPILNILYNNVANLYRDLSLYDEAETYYLKGLAIIKQHYGEGAVESANLLNNLGGFYRYIGNYKQAEFYFLKLYDLLVVKTGGKHPKARAAINNMAVINRDLGNYVKAENYFLEALKIDMSVDTVSFVSTLINLSTLYKSNGKFTEAETNYLRALELQKLSLGPNHGDLGATYFNLGSLFLEQKKYTEAKYYYDLALENRARVFGDQSFNYAIVLQGLARLQFEQFRNQESIELAKYTRQLYLKNLGAKHNLYEDALYDLADFYVTLGHLDSAETYYLEGFQIQYHLIREQFSFLSELEKELYLKKLSSRSAKFLNYCLQRKEDNPSITGEVYNYVLNTKGILLQSSTQLRNSILESENDELKNKYEQWISLKKKINNLYNTPLDKRKEDVSKLEEEANLLEKELVRTGSELEQNMAVMDNSWIDVKNQLKPDHAAIEFIHFKKSKDSTVYCALVLTQDSEYPQMLELFEEKQLITALGTGGNNDFIRVNQQYGTRLAKKNQLYKLIWEPLEPSLIDIKKVYVSPSGLLHKISFAALAKNEDTFLSDYLDIATVSTTKNSFLSTNFSITGADQIGLFGGIQYSQDTSNTYPWNYLQGTKIESDLLANSFIKYNAQVNYKTGAEATKSTFIELAEKSTILHIATHGFFFPDPNQINQLETDSTEAGNIEFRGGGLTRASSLYLNSQNPLMRSGLVFAGANDYWNGEDFSKENNGVLTALDVVNIDLRKNKLVVMSACESGLGDIQGAEGVYGLQRAFKMAGTDFIIMSLWQVPDQETAEFMRTFYKLLLKREDIAAAFSETQKIMRKKYDPYYWAAFVLLR